MTLIKNRGILLVVSGPSGTGKGTLCKALKAKNKEVEHGELLQQEIVFSISATTRKPRPGEQHGREYFFYSREEFEKKRAENGFLEWARVYDNYYGTPRDFVEQTLQSGMDCILEIDPQGALQVRKASEEAILLFIAPPSMEELRSRLAGRGTETVEEMEKRLSCASSEITFVDQYDYVIINDDVALAVEKMQAILAAEKCRTQRECNRIQF